MAVQGAAAIRLVELSAEILVALHHVEHVSQHFEHGAIGLGPDGGRTRVQAHARHFTEQIAGTELSHGVVVVQVHGSIDRNPALIGFLFPMILFALREPAGEFADEFLQAALRLYVRHRRRNGDSRGTLKHVKSSRSIFAFAANDLASAKAPLYYGTLIQAQKSSRDSSKHGEAL